MRGHREMGIRIEKGYDEECRQNNVKVEYKTLKDGFSVMFYRPEGFGETTQKTTQKILGLIEQNPEITRKELAKQAGITEDGIKFQLKKMQDLGLIRRIGPDKGDDGKLLINV